MRLYMYRHDIYLRNGILPQEETLNKTIIRDVINPSKIVSFWHTNKIIVLEKPEETVMVIKPKIHVKKTRLFTVTKRQKMSKIMIWHFKL